MNQDELALVLTTARILRALVSEQGLSYREEDLAALDEALAPWSPAPGEPVNEEEP